MRLIDADALIAAFSGGEAMKSMSESIHDERFVDALRKAPTVEVPKPARWEPSPVMPGYVRCSGCHNCHVADDWLDGKKWKHCPECGAPMENGGGNG